MLTPVQKKLALIRYAKSLGKSSYIELTPVQKKLALIRYAKKHHPISARSPMDVYLADPGMDFDFAAPDLPESPTPQNVASRVQREEEARLAHLKKAPLPLRQPTALNEIYAPGFPTYKELLAKGITPSSDARQIRELTGLSMAGDRRLPFLQALATKIKENAEQEKTALVDRDALERRRLLEIAPERKGLAAAQQFREDLSQRKAALQRESGQAPEYPSMYPVPSAQDQQLQRKRVRRTDLGIEKPIDEPEFPDKDTYYDQPLEEFKSHLLHQQDVDRHRAKQSLNPGEYAAFKHQQDVDRQQKVFEAQQDLSDAYKEKQRLYWLDAKTHKGQEKEYGYKKYLDSTEQADSPENRSAYEQEYKAKKHELKHGAEQAWQDSTIHGDVDTTNVSMGPAWKQAMDKALAHEGIAEHNRPYKEYKGQRLAPETQEEKQAREAVQKASPFKQSSKAKQKLLRELHGKAATADEVSDYTRPYLEKASREPISHAREYANAHEEDVINRLRDESNRNFETKILPKIAAQYTRPGLRRHGHQRRDQLDAYEAQERALGSTMAQLRHKGHEFSHGAAQSERGLAAELATKAGATKAQDVENKLKGRLGLEGNLSNRRQEKLDQATYLTQLGATKRAHDQKKRDLAYEVHKEREEHPQLQLNRLSNLLRGHNLGTISRGATVGSQPIHAKPSGEKSWGAFLSGFAGHKKGGKVERIRRATGGLMDQAVNNAFLERSDPLNSLHRLMNKNLMTDALQRSRDTEVLQRKANVRAKLKKGGEVSNPIEKGAEQAKHYALQDKMLQHAENLMRPEPQKNVWDNIIDRFSSGMAGLGSSDAGAASAGKAYTAAHEKSQAAKKSQKDTQHMKEKEALAIHQHIADQQSKEALEHKKLDADERHHKDLMDIKRSEIKQKADYWAAKLNKLGGMGNTPEDRPRKEQTAKLQSIATAAKHQLNAGIEALKQSKSIHEKAGKVDTSPESGFISAIPGGARLVEWGGKLIGKPVGKAEDINALRSGSENYVGSKNSLNSALTGTANASGRSVEGLKTLKAGKAGANQYKSYNLEESKETEEMAKQAILDALQILDETGMSLKELEYYKAKAMEHLGEQGVHSEAGHDIDKELMATRARIAELEGHA